MKQRLKILLSNKGMALISVIVLFTIGSGIVAGTGMMLVNLSQLVKTLKDSPNKAESSKTKNYHLSKTCNKLFINYLNTAEGREEISKHLVQFSNKAFYLEPFKSIRDSVKTEDKNFEKELNKVLNL